MTYTQFRTRLLPSRSVADLLRRSTGNLRLRTKLLFSFIFLTAALTSLTLLVVRRNAQAQVEHQIELDSQNATLTVQAVHRQQLTALSRKADLLASLAYMRNGDPTAIRDASEDPWQSDDCNLFVLVNKAASIVALHSSTTSLTIADAQQLVSRSISRGESSSWWFTGNSLYQVVLQPFYDNSSRKNLLGFVVVGRLINSRAAADLSRITSSDIVFREAGKVAVSTLPMLKEAEFSRVFPHQFVPTELVLGGERFHASSVELAPGLQPAADIIVLKSHSEADAYLERLNHLLLALGLMAIIAGAILIFLISDTVTRPLDSLVKGVHALARGDMAYPLEASGHDELSELTRAFDGMRDTLERNETQREQLEGQLRQAQKMEALGRMAGGVAHDFNNLLTVIRGHSDLLLDRLQPEDPLYRSSQQIRKTSDRAASLTRQMLAFSRMQVLQPKVLDLNELIADMGKLLRRLVREDIEFSLRLGDSLGRVKADPSQLEQVLLNLTVNASDAMPLGGKLTIETQNLFVDHTNALSHSSVEFGDYVVLSVSDTGNGMDAPTKARIFEPFFTTKEPGKGTGLGLATVYGIVKQSGGFIRVDSSPGAGARFKVYLPQTFEQIETLPQLPPAPETSIGRKTVLVVEDEREVRELACEFLKSAGYSVLTAEDGLEALDIAQRFGTSINAVLTDVVMPKMRGPALARRLKTLHPHLKIVYMTGYLEQSAPGDDFLQDAFFLQKPFSRESVVGQVAESLKDSPHSARPPKSKSKPKPLPESLPV
ncbi:MAG TPA: ATP-binding protein [Candidatus Acidoferrum sp.]|nr:ATP-binding protein [Candidatus Acidoferrum sp.]